MNKPELHNTTAPKEHFKVPEGYFENLTGQIMSQIPAEQTEGKAVKVPFWKTEIYAKVKPYIYMAAMLSGLYFGVWVYKYQQRILSEKAELAAAQKAEGQTPGTKMTAEEIDLYVDDACDYMMTDGQDIMACLTGTE